MKPEATPGTFYRITIGLFLAVAVEKGDWFRSFECEGKMSVTIEALITIKVINVIYILTRESPTGEMIPLVAALTLDHGALTLAMESVRIMVSVDRRKDSTRLTRFTMLAK